MLRESILITLGFIFLCFIRTSEAQLLPKIAQIQTRNCRYMNDNYLEWKNTNKSNVGIEIRTSTCGLFSGWSAIAFGPDSVTRKKKIKKKKIEYQ